MTFWDDLSARARGLAVHLLDPADLDEQAGAGDPSRLIALLVGTPYGEHLPGPRASALEVEDALRRRVARDLGVLARWAGPSRLRILAVLFEEEDRRSLRALARGAVAGVPAEVRMRGTIPTPLLPEDRLREAATTSSLEALAERLEAWEHPLAPAVVAESRRPGHDLFRLEVELFRLWVGRVVRAGRGDGSALRGFLEEAVDAENIRTVVARARSPAGAGKTPFADGGRWLEADAFREALRADGEEKAVRRLEEGLAGSPFQGVADGSRGTGALEEGLLERRLARMAERVRLQPVGPGTVLLFALRLRREVAALRRAIWGAVLKAPAGARVVRRPDRDLRDAGGRRA